MGWTPALPAQALGDTMPGVPVVPPFNRKRWDDPVRYKLNRAYGDEFEYANFGQLSNRWRIRTAVATDFRFDGASSILWKASSVTGQALYEALPPYDFDAVLEFQRDFQVSNPANFPALAIVDVNGTGFGVGVHQDGNLYSNAITTWDNPGTFSHSVASGFVSGQGHVWLCLRRTGGNIQGRASVNGSTWTAFTTADAIGGTPAYLGIHHYRTAAISLGVVLHRFNVYPAPAYF